MKVIITHPEFEDPGGVAKYYLKLKDKFTIPVDHYFIGSRVEESGTIAKILRMFADYRSFASHLKNSNFDIVHVNPSLDFKAFIRDGIFIRIALFYNKRTVVFFRGWHKTFEAKLKRRGLWLFRFFYGNSDAFIVLSDEFKKELRNWGCQKPIFKEVTIIDDHDLEGFDFEKTLSKRINSEKFKILFLARVIKAKGIYETIDTFQLLKTKYKNLELFIAGDGKELEKVKKYVNEKNISEVFFLGYVSGKEKVELLNTSHLLLFPSYGEGLPNSIIESMAFGLPVVSRSVGGITDLIENGKHGFITNSLKAVELAELVERILMDKELYKLISKNNYEHAIDHFKASKSAKRLENIYTSILNN